MVVYDLQQLFQQYFLIMAKQNRYINFFHNQFLLSNYKFTSGLTVPVSLFYGGNDLLADVRDVELLRQSLSDAVVYDLYLDSFNHLDFVWGTTAYKHVYNIIIQQIYN